MKCYLADRVCDYFTEAWEYSEDGFGGCMMDEDETNLDHVFDDNSWSDDNSW